MQTLDLRPVSKKKLTSRYGFKFTYMTIVVFFVDTRSLVDVRFVKETGINRSQCYRVR